jgi:hypothetical protein
MRPIRASSASAAPADTAAALQLVQRGEPLEGAPGRARHPRCPGVALAGVPHLVRDAAWDPDPVAWPVLPVDAVDAGPDDARDHFERLVLFVTSGRVPNPEDRRGMDVELTPQGRELADELVSAHVENEERMMSALTREERRTLQTIMRNLLVQLQPTPK